MTYDPSDGVSLADLIRLVRLRLADFPAPHQQTEAGDGSTILYRLQENVYETDGVTCTVGGSATTSFTMDYDSSWLTFDTAPADEDAIVFTYSFYTWTDERITEAVNAAIDELFGPFHVAGMNDELAYTGPETLAETSAGYDLGPEDRITRVERWSDPYWIRLTDWEVFTDGASKYIRLHRALPTDTVLRIHYLVRPGTLLETSDTIEGTCGLPTRAKEPVVLLACSSLVAERVNKRIRDNRSHNTQDESPVKSYEIQNDAQFLRNQAEIVMRRLRMDRFTTRLTP